MKHIQFRMILNNIIPFIALCMVVYQIIGVILSPLEPILHINTHLTFALLLVLLPALQDATEKRQRQNIVIVSVLLIMALISVSYVYKNAAALELRAGLPNTFDLLIGIILVVVVLDTCRRSSGVALPIFALIFIAYTLFGHMLPIPLRHPLISFSRAISWFSVNMSTGIYSNLLYISSNVVFLFVLFGAILQITKASEFFSLLGTLIGQKLYGGPAQTAVVSSALVGSITGGASANVLLTGTFTIPLMKKSGFSPEFAGAVEAVASSGGLLLPPVMGTAAFIMMSLTGIPYYNICLAAIIPALLYYFNAAISIYIYAKREKIPLSKEYTDIKLLIRRLPLFIIPFAIIVTLLALHLSPMYAAAWATIAAILLGLISKETRPSMKVLVDGLTKGAKMGAGIATMLATSGIFVAVMSLTALGPKVVSVTQTLSGGNLLVILVLTMFVSLLLGCAVPTSGGYLIVALLVGPTLTKMGLSIIQAHFFALFFAVIGFLTPPTAPAPLIASRVAGSSFLKTAIQAIRIAAPGYVIPFMFVYEPALLGQFTSATGPLGGSVSIIAAVLVIVTISAISFNYLFTKLSKLEAIICFASLGGLLAYFFMGGYEIALIIGISLFVVITLLTIRKAKMHF